MNAARRDHGPADAQAVVRRTFARTRLVDKLYASKIGLAPFTDAAMLDKTNDYFTGTLLLYCAEQIQKNPGVPPRAADLFPITWLDLIGPNLPEADFLTVAEARARCAQMLGVLRDQGHDLVGDFSQAGFVAAEAANTAEMWADNTTAHLETKMRYFSTHCYPNYQLGPLTSFVSVFVALAKRGTCSSAFITKIQNGIKDDTGHTIKINETTIRTFYGLSSQYLSGDMMQALFERWRGYLPPEAVRMSVTLQQAAGSGLTSLATIGRAVRLYPDFCWWLLFDAFSSEFAAVVYAMKVVRGNVFYGFNRDIDRVKSTRYPQLAWIAKELIMKVENSNTMSGYAGWAPAIKYQDRVRDYITRYQTHRMNRALVALGDEEVEPLVVPGFAAGGLVGADDQAGGAAIQPPVVAQQAMVPDITYGFVAYPGRTADDFLQTMLKCVYAWPDLYI